MIRKAVIYYKKKNIDIWVILLITIYVISIVGLITLKQLDNNILFGVFTLIVSLYILSRFGLAYFYIPQEYHFDESYEPTISFAVPSKNEEQNIFETMMRIAETDYPKPKFNIISINDGSTDGTLSEMYRAQREAKDKFGVDVIVVDWPVNKGKREGMTACVKLSNKDLVFFVDSDSFIEKNTTRETVKYFIDKKVGAVAGHAYIANANANFMTKMQSVGYFIAFKAYKGAEALFGSVTCCSGCCSAYRREYVAPFIDDWLEQTFLGVKCTYGDDRSLTNNLLKRGYTALFSPTAIVKTFAPDTFRVFIKQQLRWKKSWIRENLIASSFIWKRNPIMSIFFYIGVILPLISPIVIVRALLWYPYITEKAPWLYLIVLVLMAVIYSLYYYIFTKDRNWAYGVMFATLYCLILIWQFPYALLTIRDSSWGTR